MNKWPSWRKLMVAGALWLLVVALVQGGFQPGSIWDAAAIAVGYGMLITGFYFAMRDR
jgi:hypothetical protein